MGGQKIVAGDALGDRMKGYEAHETERRFLSGLPVYARIDGRSFSNFTRNMRRPYDDRMTVAMIETTKIMVEKTHARIGYVQSDEISLVWQAASFESAVFFDGKTQKMCSVLAGLATAAFTWAVLRSEPEFAAYAERLPHFDCRVFTLPSQTEAANMLLWRNLDATKNAVSMAARHYYSHKELHGQTGAVMQEMLFAKGVNFNDYPAPFKRGTWVRRSMIKRALTAEEMARIPEPHRPISDTLVMRSEIQAFDMPKFSTVLNREAVVFDGAEPTVFREVSNAA